MSMMQLRKTNPDARNPFHKFICSGCGNPMGKHWLFRPDRFADVRPGDKAGRQPNGRLYCHSDQVGWAGAYYQRQLRRTMEAGYEAARV